MKRLLVFTFLLIIAAASAPGQISIPSLHTPVTENFDGMGAAGTAYPAGWTAIRAGGSGTVGATLTLGVTDGTATSGNAYNTGTGGDADRALGTLASGTTIPAFGAQFVNNTGGVVNDLSFAGVNEQWRSGSSSTANEVVVCEYSLNATSLNTGTWTALPGMNLNEILTTTTTAGAVNGNNIANRASISASVSSLGLANGATLWIRWTDANDAGSDGLYALDDFSVTAGAPTGDGTGSATVDPDTTTHGVTSTLNVTYHRNISFSVTDMRIILPSAFIWSHDAGDVSFTNMTATASVSTDTVYLNGMSFSQDSTVVSIAGVTAPDSTAYYPINVQTKAADFYMSISPLPVMVNFGLPVSIGDVKGNDANGVALRVGQLVTVTGFVSVANQFGGPSYIQDNTGGIAVFGSIFSGSVNVGDEVVVTGKVDPFNGVTEITSPFLHEVLSTGNQLTPLIVTCADVKNDGGNGIEAYEGLLVRINAVVVRDTFNNPIATWDFGTSGKNYRLIDASGFTDIRVDNNVNFGGLAAPQGVFDVIGVVGQFKTTSPFIGGYQLLPRMLTDIMTGGPIISTNPVESNVTSSSFRVSWNTLYPGTTRLRVGKTTSYEIGTLAPGDTTRSTAHIVDVTGLDPATIYHVQAFSVDSLNDSSAAGDLAVITTSPPGVTGQINVYFNKSVDNSVSFGENALGNQDLVSRIVTRLDNAKRSIDVALYSLSGASYGDVIASHLLSARSRGVRVRVICEHDNINGSGFQTLIANGVPLIDDTYDAVWGGAGLSHNKFFIIDARGGAAESMWVWSGSWNPTQPGTAGDRQNSIEIQDASLASAYTTEFEVMWGSSTDAPNAANSRFGARKSDVVPHNFLIAGTPVSVYFSPSDHTTAQIRQTMGKAQHSLASCIYTFTRQDIADTIRNKHLAGAKTRMVMDNNTDTGTEYPFLVSNGIDVHLKGFTGGLLHHKYAVVDGDQSAGTQYVITGSHNWSNSAENSNDENTLIVQSRRIANLYLQEFTARYYEAGGTDSIKLSNGPVYSASPAYLNFGTVVIGNSRVDSFTVHNTGNAGLTISNVYSSDPLFTVLPTTATVAAGDSQKFIVTYSPSSAVTTNGTITIVHDASGSPSSVIVQGTGDTGIHPQFFVAPTGIDFGTITVGLSKLDSFSVSNLGTGDLVLSGVVSTNARFAVSPDHDTVHQSASNKFYVQFSPLSEGPDSALVILTHTAPGSPDTVTLRGTGQSLQVCPPMSLHAGWNMVSVPVRRDGRVGSGLFDGAKSRPFGYNSSYFVPLHDSLLLGLGYWLKYGSDTVECAAGLPVAVESISVRAGWNMIGSISENIPVSSIGQDPSGIVISNYFGYESSYTAKDTIVPGGGYWVKTKQSGTLILTSGAGPAKSAARVPVPPSNSLRLTDAAGRSQTLWFGSGAQGTQDLYTLPPQPPDGAFDVRFGSGRMAELFADRRSAEIAMQAVSWPLRIAWSVDSRDFRAYTLTSGSGDVRLTGQGELSIEAEAGKLTLSVAGPMMLPSEVTLYQNYPNPFNPTTTIPFALPHHSVATLRVYNALGEIVRTLFENEEFESGYFERPLDASALASGVYYYRLSAVDESGQFQRTAKFLLMK